MVVVVAAGRAQLASERSERASGAIDVTGMRVTCVTRSPCNALPVHLPRQVLGPRSLKMSTSCTREAHFHKIAFSDSGTILEAQMMKKGFQNGATLVSKVNQKINAIVDAGNSAVGVESTIVTFKPKPTILRTGFITPEAISNALGMKTTHYDEAGPVIAPGQMKSHYCPNANLRLNATDWRQGEKKLGFGNVECDLNLSKDQSLIEAAQNLFNYLHILDNFDTKTISVSPIPNEGIGLAINDRLIRAAIND